MSGYTARELDILEAEENYLFAMALCATAAIYTIAFAGPFSAAVYGGCMAAATTYLVCIKLIVDIINNMELLILSIIVSVFFLFLLYRDIKTIKRDSADNKLIWASVAYHLSFGAMVICLNIIHGYFYLKLLIFLIVMIIFRVYAKYKKGITK